jgi:hypothetical protein
LSPPTEGPLIKVDRSFVVCSPTGSSRIGDTATKAVGNARALAKAYSFCFFQRSILGDAEVSTPDATNRLEVTFALADYFPAAFAGHSTSNNELANALLKIRRKCGPDFTDTSLAKAIGWMASEQYTPQNETLSQFFFRQFLSGMVQIQTSGNEQKVLEARTILQDSGFTVGDQRSFPSW